MTGLHYRVMRDGEWTNVELEHLTGAEFRELAAVRPLDGWAVARALALWIRHHVAESPQAGGTAAPMEQRGESDPQGSGGKNAPGG